MIPYLPFNKEVENYYLAIDEKSIPRYLIHYTYNKGKRYIVKLKPDGYIPKSGLLLCKYLAPFVLNKRVLEIGTGETGVIAIHASTYGAKSVLASDVDIQTLKWAAKNGDFNQLTNITWIVSNVYNKIEKIRLEEKFDLIVSNPPQMPMEYGPLHDWGGYDGRMIVEKIINKTSQHLIPGGRLIILVFDFLSVLESYGDKLPLITLLKNNGFETSIIANHKKVLRKGGQTEKSINHIRLVYPKFTFLQDNLGRLYHRVLILFALQRL